MSENKAKIEALKGITKMMSKLELDRVKGYRKTEEPVVEKEEDEDELTQVLDAKAESPLKERSFGKMGRSGSR